MTVLSSADKLLILIIFKYVNVIVWLIKSITEQSDADETGVPAIGECIVDTVERSVVVATIEELVVVIVDDDDSGVTVTVYSSSLKRRIKSSISIGKRLMLRSINSCLILMIILMKR